MSNRLPGLISRLFSPLRQTVRLMSSVKDYVSHYDTLEVYPGCTKTEIREAWLKLSMLYHPDLNKGNEDATARFLAVKEAYSVLIDDEKRNTYNDSIGWSNPDPPPDFNRKWSSKAETDRIKSAQYKYLWNEAKIRELMSSEKLRDVDWNKRTPAERHQILMEEEQRQKEAKQTLKHHNTPTLLEGINMYFTMMLVCVLINAFIQKLNRSEPSMDELLNRVIIQQPAELAGGTVLSGMVRKPTKEQIAHIYGEDLSS